VPLAKPIHGEAVVQIFKSLDGDAHITSITPIWLGCRARWGGGDLL